MQLILWSHGEAGTERSRYPLQQGGKPRLAPVVTGEICK